MLQNAASTEPSVTLPDNGRYQPLQKISVPSAEIVPRGLVLVVGPNSSGKTQFLKDIQALMTGQQRSLVVCVGITFQRPKDLDALVDELTEKQWLKRFRTPDGNDWIKANAPLIGIGGSVPSSRDTHMPDMRSMVNGITDAPLIVHDNTTARFFTALGHAFVTALFLDRRLNMCNEAQNFDYETAPPANELQSLYLNEIAQQQLGEEIKEVFGKGVWLDNTRSGILCLRVNQHAEIPPESELRQPQRVKEHRTIESEGDGLRSYAGICVSLLLGLRPVCLIDEPELCLHPPQAYRMGLFIGRHGATEDHTILASTHSSHVLRGVIESTNRVQILRLTKYGTKFKGRLIGYDELKECLERPIVRAETILDGIFADGIALVEADGDRAVYQAAWEYVTKGRPHRDVLFIPVGGTGGFAEIAGFYRRLHIPVAVIADLDLITDLDKLGRILAISCEAQQATKIMAKCREVAQQIKAIPPRITPDKVRERLRELADGPIDWTPKPDEQDDDVKMRRALNSLARAVDRVHQLKAGGIEGLNEHQEIYAGVKDVVAECKRVGILLVPVGEVENWQPSTVTDAPSHKKKAEWANWAAAHIRRSPEPWGELHEFTRSLETFEKLEAQGIASE
jgi:hypothetical protein